MKGGDVAINDCWKLAVSFDDFVESDQKLRRIDDKGGVDGCALA